MTRKNRAQLGITFLDTLTNTLAAILIVAILNLGSGGPSASQVGFYYISGRLVGEVRDGQLGVMVLIPGERPFHSVQSTVGMPFRFTGGSAAEPDVVWMTTVGELESGTRVWLYLVDGVPELNEIAVRVSVSLPHTDSTRDESLMMKRDAELPWSVEVPPDWLR